MYVEVGSALVPDQWAQIARFLRRACARAETTRFVVWVYIMFDDKS
jgi:hypothetical protein